MPLRAEAKSRLPYTGINYLLFAFGLVLIIIGYYFLNIGPWDSIWSLTVAPIFLFLGYLVVLPISLLYLVRKEKITNQKL